MKGVKMDFELGKLFMTRGIDECINKNKIFALEVNKAFQSYKNCKWGDLCEEDSIMNDEAIKSGADRIFAMYKTHKGKIYIITEWDRSITTILFANEY